MDNEPTELCFRSAGLGFRSGFAWTLYHGRVPEPAVLVKTYEPGQSVRKVAQERHQYSLYGYEQNNKAQ